MREAQMANNLKAEMTNTIITLYEKGWSKSRISRELGVDRGAVSRHIRLLTEETCNSKPSIPTPGSGAKPAISTAGRKSDCDLETSLSG
jgi:hypothetical protein